METWEARHKHRAMHVEVRAETLSDAGSIPAASTTDIERAPVLVAGALVVYGSPLAPPAVLESEALP